MINILQVDKYYSLHTYVLPVKLWVYWIQ